jgi:glycine cleavage system H protein
VIPVELKYTKEHEWIKIENDLAIVGITDYAQGELGDIVFVELPDVGSTVEMAKPFGTIEAVKAISDLFSPLSGEVVEVNRELESDASIINNDPYGEGWIIKIKFSDQNEFESFIDAAGYEAQIQS